MAGKNFCELCGKAGLSSRLVPYQMNTEEAIFICENSECVYPLGNPHVGSFVVSRKATEISNIKRKRKKILSKTNPENSSLKSTTSTPEQFINWENVDALCWLDCTLSLLVHNTTIKNVISTMESSNSLLRSLLNCYTKAQELVLSDLSGAKKILIDVRHNIWTYLAPKMKCSLGKNDSPIFALPLLFRENGVTLENYIQEYSWEFGCDSCGFVEKTRHKKHLVTYPNTPKDFDFEKATFLRTCPNCKSAHKKSTIVHEKMPDLVLMHFVEGLISQDYLDSKFVFNNSTYQLTQFLQYARNPDHFICWSKENDGTRWLELDDLKPSVCSWSSSTPQVPPSEVHVVVFEKIPTESRGNKLNLEENKSEKNIDNKNGVLLPPTEISTNNGISFSKAEVCKGESISCCMDTLENNDDVKEKETTSGGTNIIVEPKLIPSDLKKKMGSKEILSCASASETHDCDTPERCPLKDCSNTTDKTVTTPHPTQTSLQPDRTPVVPRKTPSQLSSSLTSSNLDNSLFKVTLKKYSYRKSFQPSLSNKRRALSSQFQPYVPKKQRIETQIVHDKPSVLDFDNHSDSGYSSPSSVSSCGSASSTTSMETDLKMSVTDDMEKMEIDDSSHENIAKELEKLLPDCLLDDCRKRIPVDDDEKLIHSQTMKLESVSQEQDDFIRNLLFND